MEIRKKALLTMIHVILNVLCNWWDKNNASKVMKTDDQNGCEYLKIFNTQRLNRQTTKLNSDSVYRKICGILKLMKYSILPKTRKINEKNSSSFCVEKRSHACMHV